MGRFKKRGIKHFGIDLFKCEVEVGEWSMLRTVSENSNTINFDKRTIIELLPIASSKWRYYYRVYDIKTSIAIAFIGRMGISEDGSTPPRDFFEVTGQGLILRGGPQYFVDISARLGLIIKKFIRVDVCLDLINVSVPYIHDKIMGEKDKKNISKVYYDESKAKTGQQTIYIGNRKKEKNKYQLIRIYDKIADTIGDKDKSALYDSYLGGKYEFITRFEIEIREDQAKFWKVEYLTDLNMIFAIIVKKFYRINYQFFGFLKFDDFAKVAKMENSLYKERLEKIESRLDHYKTYGTSFKNEHEKHLWLCTYITYGKRLLGDGYKPEDLILILQESLQGVSKDNELTKAG